MLFPIPAEICVADPVCHQSNGGNRVGHHIYDHNKLHCVLHDEGILEYDEVRLSEKQCPKNHRRKCRERPHLFRPKGWGGLEVIHFQGCQEYKEWESEARCLDYGIERII